MTRNEMLRKRNQAETPETTEKKEDINAGYLEMKESFTHDKEDDECGLEDFEK